MVLVAERREEEIVSFDRALRRTEQKGEGMEMAERGFLFGLLDFGAHHGLSFPGYYRSSNDLHTNALEEG